MNLMCSAEYKKISNDIKKGNFTALNRFLKIFEEHSEDDIEDAEFLEIMDILRCLINTSNHTYAMRLLRLQPFLCFYEGYAPDKKECVLCYLIRNIADENVILKYLSCLKKGGQVFLIDHSFAEPGEVAMKLKKYAVVKYLLTNNIFDKDSFSTPYTALQYAVINADIVLAEFLLKKCKADINETCYLTHETPLMLAEQQENYEMASLLLEYGANPNIAD